MVVTAKKNADRLRIESNLVGLFFVSCFFRHRRDMSFHFVLQVDKNTHCWERERASIQSEHGTGRDKKHGEKRAHTQNAINKRHIICMAITETKYQTRSIHRKLLLLKTSELANKQSGECERQKKRNGEKYSENKTMLQNYTIFHMWMANQPCHRRAKQSKKKEGTVCNKI